ncbi:MAG: hypothetical protein GX054_07675, partial [Clostridiales bacterium]|nr:hypothetical protein [Clostridiales bacterium]
MKRVTKKTIASIIVFLMVMGLIPIEVLAEAKVQNQKVLVPISEPGEFVDAKIYLDGSAMAYKIEGGKKVLYRYDPKQDKFLKLKNQYDFDRWYYSSSVYGYEYIELYKEGKWTYIDKEGNKIDPPRTEEGKEKFYMFYDNGKYGIKNAEGKTVIEPIYEYIEKVSDKHFIAYAGQEIVEKSDGKEESKATKESADLTANKAVAKEDEKAEEVEDVAGEDEEIAEDKKTTGEDE